MRKRKFAFVAVVVAVTAIYFMLGAVTVSAASEVLKEGMQGSAVSALQKDLKKLGYFDTDVTGYYGEVTAAAVKKLQKRYGCDPDGIVGNNTYALIKRLLGGTKSTAPASGVLKKEMQGSAVTSLQKNLKKLGFFDFEVTGYYGDLTEAAVKKFQKKYGYSQDGIAGKNTLTLINKLVGASGNSAAKTAATASTAKKSSGSTNYMVSWSKGASSTFKIGSVATIYDIATGLSFKAKRTYGHNHADCEPVSAKDTATMKKIFGGEWSWDRRAVIVTVNGTKMAASMAGMPHAGSETAAANRTINSRSGGYGRGTNLDAVKGNSMSGHFDIHFYGSKTHGTNRVDRAHQTMVKKAAEWAKKSL